MYLNIDATDKQVEKIKHQASKPKTVGPNNRLPGVARDREVQQRLEL